MITVGRMRPIHPPQRKVPTTVKDPTHRNNESQPRKRMALLLFIIATGLGLLNFGIIHTDALASGRSRYNWKDPFVNEFTGAYSAVLLVPLMIWLWKKRPIHLDWATGIPLYLFAIALLGATHTTLMHLSRLLLYPMLVGYPFDYGELPYRYLMEFQKQVLWIPGVFGLFAFFDQIRSSQHNRLMTAKLQTRLAHAQLNQLTQQINPHFLFNSLNLISSKVYGDPDAADRLIGELADLLRDSLDLGKRPGIPLHEELGFLEKYLSIMIARFGDRIAIERDIDPDSLPTFVPSMILQPIVENSFKHRLESQQGSIRISISTRIVAHGLEIEILDAFTPSESSGPAHKERVSVSGTGLSNIRERLQLTYGNQARLESSPIDDDHFRTLIRVPLEFPELCPDTY